MARPTHDEIIRSLSQELAVLKERLENARGELDDLAPLPLQVALLQQRVDDLRKGWKTWAQRLWMLFAPVVGGLVVYYFNKK